MGEVKSVPSSLSVLHLQNVPMLGFPPRQVIDACRKGVVKGSALKKVKVLMEEGQMTHRLYLSAGEFVDVRVGIEEDVVVEKKAMEDRTLVHADYDEESDARQSDRVRVVNSMVLCVCDGHLGTMAADYAVGNLVKEMTKKG